MTRTMEHKQEMDATMKEKFDKTLQLYHKLLSGSIRVDDIMGNVELTEIEQIIKEERERLSKYPTAKLWIQYMDMIHIMKIFIKAERTGNWQMHLYAVKEMLPFFAATGHNLYLKSAYTYLQQMQTLEGDHPDIYLKFCEGYHVVRRSSR